MADAVPPIRPSLDTVRDAAVRLSGIAHRTPVMRSRTLDEMLGADVFVKCENLQRTGSFKFRGAYNAISRLGEKERARGVLTYSSGNHAQALALAGKLRGIETTVVMPSDAPRAKQEATRGYGAHVVFYEPDESVREEVAGRLAEERGLTVIPPYDHHDIVSGQGTAALELLEQVEGIELIVAPCGGGGLLSGTALAASARADCRVIGVEPELADDAVRTFRSGTLQHVRNSPTIADGLRTPSLGAVTWPIVREHVLDMVTVSESEIVEAMRFYWTRMKIVAEPSGAVALAALMNRREMRPFRRVGVIISGGNVDLNAACGLLCSEDVPILHG